METKTSGLKSKLFLAAIISGFEVVLTISETSNAQSLAPITGKEPDKHHGEEER